MSKKMIEIPEDVAREFVRNPTTSAGSELREAIKKALPPSRDELLGLPWRAGEYEVEQGSGRHQVFSEGHETTLTSGPFVLKEVARLVAKAPEMAALLESLPKFSYFPEDYPATTERIMKVLREAGWLDD